MQNLVHVFLKPFELHDRPFDRVRVFVVLAELVSVVMKVASDFGELVSVAIKFRDAGVVNLRIVMTTGMIGVTRIVVVAVDALYRACGEAEATEDLGVGRGAGERDGGGDEGEGENSDHWEAPKEKGVCWRLLNA